jgi:hypothetical protein
MFLVFSVSVVQAGDDNDFSVKFQIGPSGLFRQNNDSTAILIDLLTGNDFLNANDLNLGIAPGLDVSLGGRYRMFGAEVRFLGLHEWSASEDVVTTAFWAIPTQPTLFGLVVANIDADYDSKLYNVEVNLRWWPFDRLSVLAGFRLLQLDEELELATNLGAASATITSETKNVLLGGQVGVEGEILQFKSLLFQGDALNIGAWAKGGYFNNNISADFLVAQTIGPMYSADGSDDKGTFLCDGALNIGYAITKNVSISLRYQVLWIQKAALAPEQISGTNVIIQSIHTDTDDVLYHGPWMGISISF